MHTRLRFVSNMQRKNNGLPAPAFQNLESLKRHTQQSIAPTHSNNSGRRKHDYDEPNMNVFTHIQKVEGEEKTTD